MELNVNKVDFDIICKSICEYFEISPENLFMRTRKRHIIEKRQFFQYLCRELNPEYHVSLFDIGQYSKEKHNTYFDHATVLHSWKKMSGYIETYDDFKVINQGVLKLIKKKIDEIKLSHLPKTELSAIEIMQNPELIANL